MSEKELKFMPADVEREERGGLTVEELEELKELEEKTAQFTYAQYLIRTSEDKQATDELMAAFRQLPEKQQRAAWERMEELRDRYNAQMIALRNRHRAKK